MNAILLSLLGALLLLDKYALGEFGLSQPIITGTIIGALFGDMQTGIFIGAVIQLFFLGGLPIGRDIPPDGQVAGITGVSSFFLLRTANTYEHALFAAIILALISAIGGGAADIVARRMNEKLYRIFLRKNEYLSACHLLGLLFAYGRGLIIFLPLLVFARFINIPSQLPQLSKDLLMIIALSVGLANSLYLFFKKSTIFYFILGGICGLAFLVF